MPGPLGKSPRNNTFLLRMDDQENAFVRVLARKEQTSLNDTITGLIRERMARYGEPPAAPSAPRAPGPGFPARPDAAKRKRRTAADLEDRTPGPGQTEVPLDEKKDTP